MPLVPGTRLGVYEIVAPLGAGGMGEVYRAKDPRLGREIALKVLPAEVSADPERLARFEREARTVGGLNHPNIITLHSIEDDGHIRFLTMELVEGRSLDRVIPPDGLPVPRVIELGIALADALAAAHEKGVIHRDLKPANVMLTQDGRVKVLDFGLAKPGVPEPRAGLSEAPTLPPSLSEAGQVVGTVPYMSPEQIRGEPVDARTDLFSLGVVLYELTSGRRPFTGETHMDIGHAILRTPPTPLLSIRGGLPPDLDRIVSRCLEKNRRERAQSALDVGNELRRLGKELERSEAGIAAVPPTGKVASIAVLPFVNRSASTDDEYFSDGLADELLTVLAKIKGLRVIARSSAFLFKGKQVSIAEIGKALEVATILEGSVRKAGNRIRVSVQLVDVRDSSHLWSETYDRTLDDIFAVQDDIAQSVVKELRTTLMGEAPDSGASGAAKAEVARAAKGRATDPEAQRLFLLARHLMGRINREDMGRAIEHLKEALARDPGYALAWTELGLAYAQQAFCGWVPMADGYGRAREAAERALELEPELPEGYVRLGWIQMVDWDWRGAEVSYRRAVTLGPDNTRLLNNPAVLAYALGRVGEAIDLYRRVLEHDPLSAAVHFNLGFALDAAGRFTEAEIAYRKALELAPQAPAVRTNLSLNQLLLGDGEEALAEARREPDEVYRLRALAIVHHGLGHDLESEAALEELIGKQAEGSAWQVAEVYGARGAVDRAFEWLDRAYTQRNFGLINAKTSPQLRSLHGDPRWGAFLKKMGLEG